MNLLLLRSYLMVAFCSVVAVGCKTQMTYGDLHKWVNSQDNKMIGPEAIYPKPDELKVPEGMAIAFIRYYQNLGPAKGSPSEPFLHVRIVDLKTSKIHWAIPRQYKGFFPQPPVGEFHDIMLWFLPPGEYSLMDVDGVKTQSTLGGIGRLNKQVEIGGNFTIEKPGEVVYLSDLTATGQGLDYRVSLKDNYSDAIQEFHRTYVNATGTARNASVKATPLR